MGRETSVLGRVLPSFRPTSLVRTHSGSTGGSLPGTVGPVSGTGGCRGGTRGLDGWEWKGRQDKTGASQKGDAAEATESDP